MLLKLPSVIIDRQLWFSRQRFIQNNPIDFRSIQIKYKGKKNIFIMFWIKYASYINIDFFKFGQKMGHRVICIAVYDTSSASHRYKVIRK